MRKGTFLFRLFIFIVVVFSIVFAGVLSGVIPLLPGNKFITFSFLVLAPIDVTAGIIIYRRGFKPAIYYVVAFSLTILAAILTTSTFFGVDQSSFIGLYSHLVSSSFFALVITMGLSEKISALRAERLHNRQLITDKLDLRIEISERKEKENALLESEAQLLSLNATKDKFFSIIAHDLMNPFHAIIAYSNDMLEDLKENDIKRLERNTGFLNELAENTYSLLNNLLIWSRSQTGQISFNPVYLDISDIIAGSVKFFETIASAKSVTLINNVSSRISVKADSDMIKTIFRNLISNAIKYTYKGGRVTIDIQQNNDFLEISVTDTGIGIDDDKIDRLFSVTRSFKTLGTGNEPGTGLGLILCKEFITYHNGFISAKSSSGRGTTFTVKLPL
jgi:signal transduction histidine kinase